MLGRPLHPPAKHPCSHSSSTPLKPETFTCRARAEVQKDFCSFTQCIEPSVLTLFIKRGLQKASSALRRMSPAGVLLNLQGRKAPPSPSRRAQMQITLLLCSHSRSRLNICSLLFWLELTVVFPFLSFPPHPLHPHS